MHFGSVNAKVSALNGKLCTKEDYIAFCEETKSPAVPSFIEVYKRLRVHFYERAVRDYVDAVYASNRMDLKYYLYFWKKQEQLDKKNKKLMTRLKGTEIDLINIIRTYRLKNNYKLNDTLIYTFLIPICYRYKKENVNAEPYAHIFNNFQQPERKAIQFIKKAYKDESRKHPESLAVVMGYLFNKQIECHNLTTIQEGIRYNLPADKIMEYVY